MNCYFSRSCTETRAGAWNLNRQFSNKCGVTTNMSSDITVAHIHGLLENFSKNVYRAKDSEQGSLVSILENGKVQCFLVSSNKLKLCFFHSFVCETKVKVKTYESVLSWSITIQTVKNA